MTCVDLRLQRDGLFQASFLYRNPDGSIINLTGLVDEADFTIADGDAQIWIGSVATSAITPVLSEGRFDLLIPESAVDDFHFQRAEYRFRIRWIDKGWQVLASGGVVFDE